MSLSIDAYTSSISDIYNNKSDSSSALKNELSSKDYSNASEEELMDVCKQFETYFLEQMFKSMEKMVPENQDDSSSSASSYMEMFGEKLTQEYASLATESNDGEGIGIAQMLYEQMKRNYNL